MKIAICDDEKIFRERIIEYLKPYKENNSDITVYEFCTGEELLSAYADKQQFDILFLDILLKDIDGVEAAKKIRDKDKNAIIIFITGYLNYVAETFRVGAFQCLFKPITQADFNKDFDRALETYRINHYKHTLRCKDDYCIVEINEILYIEVKNRHLIVITEDNNYECLGTISEEENKLTGYKFTKCHQGCLVNMRYIKLIGSEAIQLTNGKEIPLSKRYRANVKAAFNDYILGCGV